MVLGNLFFMKWMDKNAKKYGKVSRPGLYKRNLLVQERPSIQQVCYSTSCFLFIVTCYTWQVWSNAAKRVQMRWTFADVNKSNDLNESEPNETIWDKGKFYRSLG